MTGDGASASAAEAVRVAAVTHRYGDRAALDGVSFEVAAGAIFGLLGPNGSGKTTLFRILSTLLRPTAGDVTVFGADAVRAADAVRRAIGVVFQSPSLDPKLTVAENLRCQAALYGLGGAALGTRMAELLARFGLTERTAERTETLSGGLKRRAELAKALLHRPRLLLLDEPSTGIDPHARREFWDAIRTLRREEGVTAIVTTHIMEEAEVCDRIALLDRGRLVALDTPTALKAMVGGDVLGVRAASAAGADDLARRIAERFGPPVTVVDGVVRLERHDAGSLVTQLLAAFGADVEQIALGKPTLEDVFVRLTGHHLATDTTVEGSAADGGASSRRGRRRRARGTA